MSEPMETRPMPPSPIHATKPYRDPRSGQMLDVDVDLSTAMLDRLNGLPGLWVMETCQGERCCHAYVSFIVTGEALSIQLLEEFAREVEVDSATQLGRSSELPQLTRDLGRWWILFVCRDHPAPHDWWEWLVAWLERQTADPDGAVKAEAQGRRDLAAKTPTGGQAADAADVAWTGSAGWTVDLVRFSQDTCASKSTRSGDRVELNEAPC